MEGQKTINKVITEAGYKNAAKRIGCEVAVIKAVAEVESNGSGWLNDGQLKILFEPHVFWRCLIKQKIIPTRSNVCYPKWGTLPYGKTSEQHGKLQKAIEVNRSCALMGASWGAFQILGENYLLCGCKSIQEFINKMGESADSQLMLFCEFVISCGLSDELRLKQWEKFASIYNGKGYKKNNYHVKLPIAYKKHKV